MRPERGRALRTCSDGLCAPQALWAGTARHRVASGSHAPVPAYVFVLHGYPSQLGDGLRSAYATRVQVRF